MLLNLDEKLLMDVINNIDICYKQHLTYCLKFTLKIHYIEKYDMDMVNTIDIGTLLKIEKYI